MPGFVYRREDFPVRIRQTASGGAAVEWGRDGRLNIRAPTVRRWLAQDGYIPPDELAANLRIAPEVIEWAGRGAPAGDVLRRVTIDVEEALAGLAWESALGRIGQNVVVRSSPVRPKALAFPLTLPLRVLVVDPVRPDSLKAAILGVFGGRSEDVLRPTIRVNECPLAEMDAVRAREIWPTVDVLHFDHFWPVPDADRLLSTTAADMPGTLGWFLRFTTAAQTRLIVLRCASVSHLPHARRLADGITRRGGPAVVCEAGLDDMRNFYADLIHDRPLDVIGRDADAFGRRWLWSGASLFAGGGREEALRVSAVGERLLDLSTAVTAAELTLEAGPQPKTLSPGVADLFEMVGRRRTDTGNVIAGMQDDLDDLATRWPGLEFHLHESDGMIPLAEALDHVRRRAGIASDADLRRPGPVESDGPPAPRFVNAGMWAEAAGGRLEEIPQVGARLTVGRPYHLGVQIGPRNVRIRVAGAVALLEEVFQWADETAGVYVEVGVSGVDFDVLGHPVQELWLPRSGASDAVYFAVVPRRPGVSRLRFTLYYRDNVVQSYRMAALMTTRSPGQDRRVAARAKLVSKADRARAGKELDSWALAERHVLLAPALELPADKIQAAGYMARLDYAMTADLAAMPDAPGRVSIVANRAGVGGADGFTVKGGDFFHAQAGAALPARVKQFRDALEAIASAPSAVLGTTYAFFGAGGDNAGTPAQFAEALKKLAHVGWALYSSVGPADAARRAKLAAQLAAPGQVIQVAQTLIEKVIPWAVVYDRKYDANAQASGGRPVTHEACLASLPRDDGSPAATACGRHPDCLLHPAQLAARPANGPTVTADTVACPLHFWGYRHQIELPVQQVGPDEAVVPPVLEVVNGDPVRVTAGFHAGLTHFGPHWTALQQLSAAGAGNWLSSGRRDDVLAHLKTAAADVVYFFCHTREDRAAGDDPDPCLEVADAAGPGAITAAQLDDAAWVNHPLVILNGCQTVGFTPKALSPFVATLVQTRKAAGVLGTEVPVWEPLAAEMALHFLTAFFAGRTAGEALLAARRALLAKHNPLGLVYTLYAAADLKLRTPAPAPAVQP